MNTDDLSQSEARKTITRRLVECMSTATPSLVRAQRKYKAYFNAHVRPVRYRLKVGYLVFLKRERPELSSDRTQGGEIGDHKILPKFIGPFEVLPSRPDDNFVTIQNVMVGDTVSLDRVVLAPQRRSEPGNEADAAREPLTPNDEWTRATTMIR